MNQDSPTALVIENELPARKRLELYLNSRGATFDFASDPRAAIEKLANTRYNLVFLDLDLGAGGTLEGSGVLAWMDRHGRHIPTIVISESSPFPSVIRLEKAYSHFVKLRMMHGDLDHVPDLVDELLRSKTAAPRSITTAPSALVDANDKSPRSLPRGVLLLLCALLILLIAFSVVATRISSLMFLPVVIAAILAFALIVIAWLMSTGMLSESGFLKVIATIMKKVPRLGPKP
jgi:CheY-like chemotaxis protein